MNKEILESIKKLQRKLKLGDKVTIQSHDFQVLLNGIPIHSYSKEESESDKQLKFDMAGL